MMVLWVLIGISVAMATVAGCCFVWANDSGQYDDLDSPGARLIFEDSFAETKEAVCSGKVDL
jgi:cbb3-type cytochrome oxidase maturation protein